VILALGLVGLALVSPLAFRGELREEVKARLQAIVDANRHVAAEAPVVADSLQTTQPQVAPYGPLVAEDIDLDPSITETPALPLAVHQPFSNVCRKPTQSALELSPHYHGSAAVSRYAPAAEPGDDSIALCEAGGTGDYQLRWRGSRVPVTKAWAYRLADRTA
jgi:hypothetical protein